MPSDDAPDDVPNDASDVPLSTYLISSERLLFMNIAHDGGIAVTAVENILYGENKLSSEKNLSYEKKLSCKKKLSSEKSLSSEKRLSGEKSYLLRNKNSKCPLDAHCHRH